MGKANQFTGKASAYGKHRPNYPQACIDFIVSATGLKQGDVVADVGAGTGIFSRQLSESGLQVVAVEPNADMRAQAEKTLADCSDAVILPGSAEETGIAAGSVRLVTAAQAFHWFDAAKFRAECKRILVPGGRVALVWNSRDLESPLIRETAAICSRLCPNFNGFSGGIEEKPEVLHQFFDKGIFDYRAFENPVMYDRQGLIGRYLSSSFAPKPSDANYQEYIAAFGALFDRYNCQGYLSFPYKTRCYRGSV
ncbi:MAG: class I SAM-dependent methyltransferase [Oscillospiraceae bacterium]